MESEAPEHLRLNLLKALRLSLNVHHSKEPASASQIADQTEVLFEALLYFEILLSKKSAAEFLFSLGYAQSPSLIEKQLLKEGRYRERFQRGITLHKNKNIYTYAELIALIERPLIQEKFEKRIHESKI